MKARYLLLLFSFSLLLFACNNNKETKQDNVRVVSGLYIFGPEIKSFTDCSGGSEYWVVDSVKKLELSYSQFNFEKPYEPVYVELEGYVVADTTFSADFDSTLVVTKLRKISKTIPDGPCSQ